MMNLLDMDDFENPAFNPQFNNNNDNNADPADDTVPRTPGGTDLRQQVENLKDEVMGRAIIVAENTRRRTTRVH